MSALRLASGLALIFSATCIGYPVDAQQPAAAGRGECVTFQTALATAAAFSPSAQVELAQRDIAFARLEELRATAWPQVSLFGRSLAGDADLSDAQIANQMGLRVTQDIFDFSKRTFQEKAVGYDLQSARQLSDASKDVAALDVGLAYLQALEAREQTVALSDEVESLSLLSRTLQELSTGGGATVDEVLETNARLAALEAQVAQLQLLEMQAKSTVGLLTGVETLEICPSPNLDAELAASHARLAGSDEALRQAIVAHPRVQAANLTIMASSAKLDYERNAWLPTLRGVGTYAYGQDDANRNWDQRSSLGLEFSVPLFSGGAQNAREKAASARSTQATKSRDLAVLELEQQFRRALQTYDFGANQYRHRVQATDYKRQQTALLKDAYDDGARTLRELLEVQSELTANEFASISNRFELLRAALTIHVLAGDANIRTGVR